MRRVIEIPIRSIEDSVIHTLEADFKSINLRAVPALQNGERVLLLIYNTEDINTRTGRKRIKPDGYEYTLGEVKALKSQIGAKKCAQMLGISKSTLYRRLREFLQDKENSEDTLIFLTKENKQQREADTSVNLLSLAAREKQR